MNLNKQSPGPTSLEYLQLHNLRLKEKYKPSLENPSFSTFTQLFFSTSLLPAFLSQIFLASYFPTDWLSRLGLGNQVGSITHHL